ncbi:NBS resistance protein, partial [Trifolium medium]|nr:NBS resistance protein [Trifolium medium]
MLDDATKKRAYGHYARILVDIDMSKMIYDEVMVERDDFAFYMEVIYERLPEYCNHCYSIGYSVANCRKLHPQQKSIEKVVKVQVQKHYIPKQSTVPVIVLEKQAPVIDLEKQQHARNKEDIVPVDDVVPVMCVTESFNT